MLARAQTWWTILRICIEERLVYRGDFMLGTLMRFMPIITQIFLWTAVYAAASRATLPGGFSKDDVIAYYLLTMVGRAFSSMPGLASGIARQIREGEIKKFLIQPIDLIGFLLLARIAHKLVYYAVAIIPFGLVFYLCRDFFTQGWPPAPVLAAFVLSLIMSFLLGFFLEAAIGMIGFWFLEVSSLLFVYMLFNFFFSGHMFPLTFLTEFLPGWLQPVMQYQPLQYLAYFPAAVFLGKISGPELVQGLMVQAIWVVVFVVVCRVAMQRGFKRYSGYGG
ncbi:ABC-2 family transporter protein [Aeoliella sp. ICT_H6.2]|uniref:ABC-2 family transporter protein n=1 Tax=Aeoliella straminimaris TaxID=2954799 RepID=A0A9X2JJD2_9BACT|nr:ABC-2 family transporter protein [Aeoliella straminimaris]MCO6047741.1 ABC-2 family transporter protein [Aeoliella straminimaris]